MKTCTKYFALYGFLLASIISATGCFPHIHQLPAATETPAFPLLPPPEDDTIIGIAFSGGGSRAAYFSAAGLEAFARLRVSPQSPSLLERVAYISSVSGGSVASTYFVMEKPGKKESVLSLDGTLTEGYRTFFDAYLKTMASDIQGAVVWRQFYKIRWFDSNQRATSLAEVLDNSFLKKRTFKDLYEREQQGDAPRLILNTTIYNNGRRAVMTTLPDHVFEYKFFNQLQKELEANPHDRGIKPLPVALQNAQEALIPVTFEALGADGRGVPLSMAVAASASFPPLIGPITIQVQGDPEHIYHHLGDGGLFDNQGTESLVQLLLQRNKENKKKRALVIAFDSSFPFWGKSDALNHFPNGFKIFADDPGRIVGIMEQRANAYQSAIWHILQNQNILLPDDNTIKVIPIRHTEDVWPEDWKRHIPHECADDADGLKEKKDILQRLALMPTLFELKSDCDRALLNEAAKLAVAHHKDEILGFLNQKPK